DARPLVGFFLQLPPALRGEAVVLGVAACFGLAEGRLQPARLLHAVQGGKERPGFDVERAARHLFDAPGDAEAMALAEGERLEDEEVESALQQLRLAHS